MIRDTLRESTGRRVALRGDGGIEGHEVTPRSLIETRIRTAVAEDLPAIVGIYNDAIAARATADTLPVTVDERRGWVERHEPGRRPILVAESDGEVVGWASLSDYRGGRLAVRHTAEIAYFVRPDRRREGVGAALVRRCVELSPELEIRTLFAIILDDNEPSIRLLRKFDFELWGHLPGVADFDGREVGHVYYGRRVG